MVSVDWSNVNGTALTALVFLGDKLQVKLGDFGLSKVMQSHDFASTYVGTPYYMSPEICASERYTLASDIWALGCIMYELCARKVPFNANTQFQLVQKIKEGRVDPLPDSYSPYVAPGSYSPFFGKTNLKFCFDARQKNFFLPIASKQKS